VLAAAAAFEFFSWRISYRELDSRRDPNESVFDEIVGSKDPTIFTVFLEDSAGLVGTTTEQAETVDPTSLVYHRTDGLIRGVF
jgi:hypothetical protein